MEFKPLFYSFLILSIITFFEVLINIRKSPFLKICFLLIIASLFLMNYFSYVGIINPGEFVLVKTMRAVCILSALMLIIQVTNARIPRWFVWTGACLFVFFTVMRLYFFNQINIEHSIKGGNLIFSPAKEFNTPQPMGRLVLFCVLILVTGIIIYYYWNFVKQSDKKNIYHKRLSEWIVFLITPFLLLTSFGMLSFLDIFNNTVGAYFFSFFSFMVVVTILFRPKFLNSFHVSLALISIQKHAGPGLSSHLFNSIFFNGFYYLEKTASLAELSSRLETTEANVREFVQQEYGMGVIDLINKFRIDYMLDLLKDRKNRHFTIEYLSQKAGFPSRSTMYRAFSRFHGGHPSEYISKLNDL